MQYPDLPVPPAPGQDDTAIVYGCRLLSWILDSGVYATCTAEQLKAIDHAACFAVTAAGILPAAVDKISAVRHEINGTLRRRAALAAEQPSQAGSQAGAELQPCSPAEQPSQAPGSQDDRPSGGSLIPRRPYPSSIPPAGSLARVDF